MEKGGKLKLQIEVANKLKELFPKSVYSTNKYWWSADFRTDKYPTISVYFQYKTRRNSIGVVDYCNVSWFPDEPAKRFVQLSVTELKNVLEYITDKENEN